MHWTYTGANTSREPRAKRGFSTLDDALRFMEDNRMDKNIFTAYVCDYCGQWHIGHRKK